ncbi:MAG TPA: aromatic ring-hydroxylating dioxygenase subunit alpha, partial [Candidatus Binatia bacterium]
MVTSLKQLIDGYDSNGVLSEASTPPSSWYSDPRILELEQQTVFSRSWQMVGRVEQLREPGQYVTCDVAGEPTLLITGHDGVVRGFYNVCRHHAAAVITESQGRAKHLRCPYHGWTYNLDGALVVTPEFGSVRNFDKSANGLVPVETAIWQGWVFVKLVSNGTSLEAYLGKDLIERIQSSKLEQLSWFDRRWYSVKCNWKVFIDNYLDGGYHVPHIHGALNSVLDYGAYTIETGDR